MQPKTSREIEAMRASGRILKAVFAAVRPQISAGVTTKDLALVMASRIKAEGGEPVLLGYKGFPDVACVSVNEQVVHGIPGNYILKDGDLVSLDLCVGYRGMITDSAFTAVVGGLNKTTSRVRTAIKATEEALYQGIDAVKNGSHIGDVSHAIEKRLRRDNLGIIEDLVGHGVGHSVHEEPEVPNYGVSGQGRILKTGMTIAIEPMATLGGKEVYLETDNWTVSTRDHSLSTHFEHTVLVTAEGYEILT